MEHRQQIVGKKNVQNKFTEKIKIVKDITQKMASYSNEELVTNDTFAKLRRRNKMRKFRRGIFYASIGLVICIVFSLICSSVFFKVAEITVEGSTIYREDTIKNASGIELEEHLMKINPKAVESHIVMNYPYIKSVNMRRIIPTTVELKITEDYPKFFTKICGEYFVLSETLRVLQRADKIGELKATYDLIELKSPEISYAVVGKQLVYKKDVNLDYTMNFIAWLASTELYEKINIINISDKYRIYVVYDNSYKIVFGKNEELDIKLKLVNEILTRLGVGKGIIDVQNIEPSFAILQNNVDLS